MRDNLMENSQLEDVLSDVLISHDEEEELTSGCGADGGEEGLRASEVVGHEAHDAVQDRLFLLTTVQLGKDVTADA
jgi:hypothetical protein